MGRLEGRVALITGATSGIGQATARLFGQEGAQVMIAARREDKGREVADSIANVAFVRCDVRLYDDCQHAVDETLRIFGQVDILFNNAGIVPVGTVLKTSLETWNDVLATNVSGTFHMSRVVLPYMIDRGKGVIVNCGSDWSVVGGQEAAAYCATKGAVALLTKAMALDHARQGIRINAIFPGDTYVERWNNKLKPEQTVNEYLSELGKGFPMGRVASVDEIARGVLFLASDDSSYMTGQLLVMDGGNTAGGVWAHYD